LQLSTGIVLCLVWNFIAVIVCWIRGGGELSTSFNCSLGTNKC
jgi:hypothetical protein